MGTPRTLGSTEAGQGQPALKLVLDVQIQGRSYRALLDSGAMTNCISPAAINRHQLPWYQKKTPYRLYNLEGDNFTYNNGLVDKESDQLPCLIQGREIDTRFDVIDIRHYDLILGFPWLWENNPMVNWRTGQLRWWDTEARQNHEDLKGTKFRDEPVWLEYQRPNRRTRRAVDKVERHAASALTATQTDHIPKTPKQEDKLKRRTIGLLHKYVYGVQTYMQKKLQEHEEQPKQGRMDHIPQQYRKYEKLFAETLDTGIPQHNQWDHEICLHDGTNPTFSRIYPLNQTQLEALREYLDEMLAKGYIRKSTSEAAYPVMFVPKKNGKLRLVVDYRKLNAITKKDRTPLPLTNELKDRLVGKRWFTALDLKGAYNLIRMKEGDEWKTAFTTKFGLYEYLVMPFGLTNAPATFQRMINNVLREQLDISVVVYLDDILIFSENEEQHQEHVHWALNKLQEANLLVDPEKSKFHQKEVEFLGHIIRPGEIAMEPAKIQTVVEWKEPNNVKETQAFIGFANYYRRFIRDFSRIALPLTEITKKGNLFAWDEKCQTAFDALKKAITSEPVLTIFDPEKPTELETDASDYAIAGQIGQRDEQGRLKPIAFFSAKLKGPELNYPIYDKEFMAIVRCFEEFRHYLQGGKHRVKVYTDHKNITFFTTTQELSKRQLRYAETLAEFDYEIIHRKGSENGRADAMSRRADYDTGQPVIRGQVLERNQEGNLEQRQVNLLERIDLGSKGCTQRKVRQLGQASIGATNSAKAPTDVQGSTQASIGLGEPAYADPSASSPTHAENDTSHVAHNQNSVRHLVEVEDPLHEEIIRTGQTHMMGMSESDQSKNNLTRSEEVESGTSSGGSPREPGNKIHNTLYKGKIWIPGPELAERLIRTTHEHPTNGHPGIRKTLDKIQRTYDCAGLRRIVETIVKNCDECNKTKSARHKPYGELQPLKVPLRPWSSIAFDHIVKLPKSKIPGEDKEYDSILVITDRLTKYGYFMPYIEASSAQTLAYHVNERVISNHGLPDEIVSDRGTTFASNFWQALMALLGVKHKLSTAYHPQTNGQTERLNQILEQYLRCYLNYDQDNWAELLPTAQFAYNSAYQESTKISPFYANYGYEPEIVKTPREGPLAEQAIIMAEDMSTLHAQMRKELEFVRARMSKYYNQGRLKGPTFERGDMVYLLTKNFDTTRPSKKLDYKKVGPFEVEERISTNNYRLRLPKEMQLKHPIFHISLLEPGPKDMTNVKPRFDIEVYEEEFEPEEIIDKKRENGEVKYLVKWKGCENEENTWEPVRHLKKAQRLLKAFHQNHPERHSQEAHPKKGRGQRRTSQ